MSISTLIYDRAAVATEYQSSLMLCYKNTLDPSAKAIGGLAHSDLSCFPKRIGKSSSIHFTRSEPTSCWNILINFAFFESSYIV